MNDSVIQSMLELIINGIPNFVGFVILSWVMWKIITRQLDLLEMLVVDCLEDNDCVDKST